MDSSTENLVDSLAIIKQVSLVLRKYIDEDNYQEVINTSVQLLSELRNGALSPKDYFEVWTAICEQLVDVECYFCQVLASGVSGEELYEQVQYTPTFIPRLYLMILVGSCCIRTKQVPAKKIIYDTLEMCKGIQNPMRGLFLRNFFIREMKDKFPYPGCRYETEDGGDVNDSVDCILRNFVEMNRLWIRMQSGKARDQEAREHERKELKVLVGTNLGCLSQLEGIDAEYYRNRILPALVNEIISCNDPIAQEYLTESVIQVFPEDFHLAGLGHTLECLSHLHASVAIQPLMEELLERVCDGAEPLTKEQAAQVTNTVFAFVRELREKGNDLPLEALLAIEIAFLKHLLRGEGDQGFEEMDELCELTLKAADGMALDTAACQPLFTEFLLLPLERYQRQVLQAEHYLKLFDQLPAVETTPVALRMAELSLAAAPLTAAPEAEALLRFLRQLYAYDDSTQQAAFARCLHLLCLEPAALLPLVAQLTTAVAASAATSRYIPLLALVAVLLRRDATATSAPEPAAVYAAVEPILEALKAVGARHTVLATLRVAAFADSVGDTEKAVAMLEAAIALLAALQGKERETVHTAVVCALLRLRAPAKEELVALGEKLVAADRAMSLALRVGAQTQCAMMYAVKTPSALLLDEEKAKALVAECEKAVAEAELGLKEKNAAKAQLLGGLVRVSMTSQSVVSAEKLQALYKELKASEKLGHATKRVLEALKPYVA
ncbi:vacuolar protein sorting protein [Blastocystis sp. ATCC 50177/Nand II]|uniref:Vacuolar protein sorting protein n=1 Tax=Blastocystis sp. subtype 1 (strain ATCC 50177 / NandII) TaxID=478820 RepID=A0A196SBZ5_BLAHN|nr:vacuolar protein sorting protein [Blastocystis sp. ATCC 50177/Nand II]